MGLAIQLPPHEDQQEFNLGVWQRMLADPVPGKIEGRFESDRHGHVIMRTNGSMRFHTPESAIDDSRLCPGFPTTID